MGINGFYYHLLPILRAPPLQKLKLRFKKSPQPNIFILSKSKTHSCLLLAVLVSANRYFFHPRVCSKALWVETFVVTVCTHCYSNEHIIDDFRNQGFFYPCPESGCIWLKYRPTTPLLSSRGPCNSMQDATFDFSKPDIVPTYRFFLVRADYHTGNGKCI